MMRYLFLIIFIFLNVSFATSSKSKELEKVSLQLSWKYQFEFAGFIAAKEKGFYKDVGLDVDLKEYKSGMSIEDEVLNSSSEYGIYSSLSLLEYLKGKQLKLVSSYFKRSSLVLVTKPDIYSPKDLIGKKVMVSTKRDFILNFKPYFDVYNVDINRVNVVSHSFNINAFVDGNISAMTAFTSNELLKLDDKGIKYNIFNPSDENFYVIQMELITSNKEVLYHSNRVQAFKEASIRGWKYALSHKNELINIIHDKYNKKLTKKELKREAVEVEKLILPFTYNIGSIDKNFLNKQNILFKEHNKTRLDKDVDDYVFDDKKIRFTKNELIYIKHHKKINLCVNYGLFPIDGYSDGKLTGVTSDIFKLISDKTSIKFLPIKSNSEKELIHNLNTKKCKVLSVVATQNKRFKNIVATKAFSSTNFALLSTLDKSFIHKVSMLKNKLLIVQKDSFKDYLTYLYPYLNIEVEYNKDKIIKKLLNNEVYAIVTLDEQADYFIGKYGYGKLKINGFLAKKYPIKGSIGIDKDEPILYSIIQKSLNSISKNKIQAIENSWRISRYQKTTDYSLVLKVLGAMSAILFGMILYHRKLQTFNRQLESLVSEKTKELRDINDSLEETVAQKVQELIKKDEILTKQSKQAVMGEMISMIAHQWRQPLNMVTLSISNIQIKYMTGNKIDYEELNKSLDEISNTIVYLSETIDDFKTYFHPDKKKTVMSLDSLIEKAVNFIVPRLKSDSITLEHKKSEDIKIAVYPNELIQVFLNILNNAIDAYKDLQTPDKKIIITTQLHESEAYIYIEDMAGGVKKEHIKQLFEPYFSTKGKNGTGLGLYMSQMIIEKQFKGEIYLNTSDEGTTFIVKIPMGVL